MREGSLQGSRGGMMHEEGGGRVVAGMQRSRGGRREGLLQSSTGGGKEEGRGGRGRCRAAGDGGGRAAMQDDA